MNKRYAAAVMAALAMAGTVHAQTADQKLRSYETWGSVMGDFNGVSGKDVTYFGANGQPVAEVNYDAYQDGTFEPSGYTYYGYDDNGRVVKEWSQEYKIGTGNVMEWKDKDSIVYQYNDAGYLVSERNYLLGDSTAYEYDADEGGHGEVSARLPGRLHRAVARDIQKLRRPQLPADHRRHGCLRLVHELVQGVLR
jgi:hypothetical protein